VARNRSTSLCSMSDRFDRSEAAVTRREAEDPVSCAAALTSAIVPAIESVAVAT